jgi:hypothetical protein
MKQRIEDLSPELLARISQDAAQKERQRLAALEEMRGEGTEELVQRAIDRGLSPESIALEALEIVRTTQCRSLEAPPGTSPKSRSNRVSVLAQALVRKQR